MTKEEVFREAYRLLSTGIDSLDSFEGECPADEGPIFGLGLTSLAEKCDDHEEGILAILSLVYEVICNQGKLFPIDELVPNSAGGYVLQEVFYWGWQCYEDSEKSKLVDGEWVEKTPEERVTPEMIKAGKKEIINRNIDCIANEDFLRAIYIAMEDEKSRDLCL